MTQGLLGGTQGRNELRTCQIKKKTKNHIIGSIITSKDSLPVKICKFKKYLKNLKTTLLWIRRSVGGAETIWI